MTELFAFLKKEWAVVSSAPSTFLFGCLLVAGVVWLIMHWAFRARLDSKDAQISLLKARCDDYKEKLGGATPSQAQEKIALLETRLAKLEPRRLTNEQRQTITTMTKLSSADIWFKIEVAWDGSCFDCEAYAHDFRDALEKTGGWKIEAYRIFGVNRKSSKGLAIFIPNPNAPPSHVMKLMRALEKAEIPYDLIQQENADHMWVQLLVSSRAA
jgi:hypothetical protein